MRQIAWLLRWILKAAIFFVLFAFALNNPHAVTVHWLFGQSSVAPLIIVVLASFVAGLAVGVLGMAPHWWRQRRRAQRSQQNLQAAQTRSPDTPVPPGADASSPSRDARPIDGI